MFQHFVNALQRCIQFCLIADTSQSAVKTFKSLNRNLLFCSLVKAYRFKVTPSKSYQALLSQSHIQEQPSNVIGSNDVCLKR